MKIRYRINKLPPIGTRLEARNDYFMRANGQQFLTKGKKYCVVGHDFDNKKFKLIIIDNQGSRHWLSTSYFIGYEDKD